MTAEARLSLEFDAVLFDLDGTIIDSTELIIESYRHTLGSLAGVEPSAPDIIRGFGTPLIDNLRRLSPRAELVPQMMEVYSEYNARRHDELVMPFSDVVEAIRELHGCGVKLAIVTGKRRKYALMGVARAELSDCFDALITPESTARGKPHPDPVFAALEALGTRADRSILVGDSPHDIAAARAAGVKSAAVRWGPFEASAFQASPPDYWLEVGADVLSLVGLSVSAP